MRSYSRQFLFPLALFVLIQACDRGSNAGDRSSAPPGGAGGAATDSTVGDTLAGDWRTPSLDYAATRFSPLAQIDTANVAGLRLAFSFSTGVLHGHEGQPLVVDGTMYVVTPFPNILYALDPVSGAVKWSFNPHPDENSVGIACCDIVNRGLAYADGKIIYNTLDAHTVAVDAQSGKEVWRTKVGDIARGETTTMAPLVVRDKVLVGNSGGELGVRGWILALDLATGAEVWRAYNSGPDADVRIGEDFHAFYAKDQGKDLGVSSWPPRQWQLGGGTVWGWLSYDPELDLVYYGSGNPGVWNPDMRPGDNKWSLSIFARDPDDGSARWAYQITPHDMWDYDEIMENVLIDAEMGGRVRKLLVHPARNGYVFVLDRETGELLKADNFQYVNWSNGYDLKTGLPRVNPEKQTKEGVVTRDICPSSTGAKEFVPSSYSRRTRLLYIPSMHICMDYMGAEVNYIEGTPYVGAEVVMKPGPLGYRGELIAWDPIAGRRVWSVKEDFPVYSGVLSTDGGLVFYGTMDGTFKALNARTGELLWKIKLGSGIIGNPITYRGPDGRQYVAIYSGIGGWMGAVAFPELSTSDPSAALGVVGAVQDIKKVTAQGGTLYVFAL